jgi:hypothetical protein
MWSIAFFCFTSCLNCATLLQVGLFEVPVTYLGSHGYFPAWGPVLPDRRPSEKLLLMGGSGMCSLLSLVLYPKRAHSTSRTLPIDYWGPRCRTALNRSITIIWVVLD